jgi:hypothetical protein
MVIEAETPEKAKEIALNKADEADWRDGSDSYETSVWQIEDAAGKLVWERW